MPNLHFPRDPRHNPTQLRNRPPCLRRVHILGVHTFATYLFANRPTQPVVCIRQTLFGNRSNTTRLVKLSKTRSWNGPRSCRNALAKYPHSHQTTPGHSQLHHPTNQVRKSITNPMICSVFFKYSMTKQMEYLPRKPDIRIFNYLEIEQILDQKTAQETFRVRELNPGHLRDRQIY